MFTLRVVKDSGDESLYEATHIDKEETGLLVQTTNDTVFIGEGGQQMSLDASRRQRVADEPPYNRATVYVMNSHGSTVAQYYV